MVQWDVCGKRWEIRKSQFRLQSALVDKVSRFPSILSRSLSQSPVDTFDWKRVREMQAFQLSFFLFVVVINSSFWGGFETRRSTSLVYRNQLSLSAHASQQVIKVGNQPKILSELFSSLVWFQNKARKMFRGRSVSHFPLRLHLQGKQQHFTSYLFSQRVRETKTVV